MSESQKRKVVELLESLATGDTHPYKHINKDNFVQHDPMIADGASGFEAFAASLPKGPNEVEVVRLFQDGDYVFTHMAYDFSDEPKVGFDIFKLEHGEIVAHWDNLTKKEAKPNPSGHSQIDGVITITDRDKTAKNKKTAARFVDTILKGQQFDKITEFIDPGPENYIQHNPVMADGIDGLESAMKALAAKGVTMEYDQTHKVLGEGNFVLCVSEGKVSGTPSAYYDLLRLHDNKIVEHWGAIEAIPPESEWKNHNGKFGF